MQSKEKILSALQKRFPDIEISITTSKTSFMTEPKKEYDRVLVSVQDKGTFAVMNTSPMDIEETTGFIVDKIDSPNTVYGK